MHRTPRGLVTAGLAVVFALSTASLMAQDQGNQRGQRGPGGPGGWGGPGGRGGPGGAPSIPMLLQQEAVQTDLKLTDSQKEQVKDITTKANAKRDETFRKMQAERDSQRNNNNNGGGNNNNNNGGNDRREAFRAVMEQMNAAQQETEAALAKVLNANQKSRVKQIALQVEGPQAFVGESLSSKLLLEAEQVESIRGILDDLRSTQRELMASTFGFGRDNNNGDRGNNRGDRGNNRGGDNNANGGDRGNNNRGGDRAANNTNGGDRGNNRGGNNNANGGDRGNNQGGDNNGGNRPPRFDFNDPANQAKMAQMGKDRLKLNDKAMAAIAKVLSPAQRTQYIKMVGAKFDVSKINMRGPGGPGGPGGPPPANATAAAPASVNTTAATDAAAKPAATSARPKSLSERRAAAAGGNKPN